MPCFGGDGLCEPLKVLSDFQVGDQKVTLNHFVHVILNVGGSVFECFLHASSKSSPKILSDRNICVALVGIYMQK